MFFWDCDKIPLTVIHFCEGDFLPILAATATNTVKRKVCQEKRYISIHFTSGTSSDRRIHGHQQRVPKGPSSGTWRKTVVCLSQKTLTSALGSPNKIRQVQGQL